MLSPNDLEYIADDILEVYSKLNERIIEDIARRLVNAGTMTESARWQIQIAQETGLLYDNIMEMVSDNMGTSEDVVRQIFEDAAIESLEFDDKIYKKAGLNPIPLYQSATMLNILRAGLSKTNGLINNLCMTTASSGQDAFIQASDNAYMDVVTGAFDYNTAIFNAVEKLSDEGLYVTYPSGYKNRIDVAIRRNVVTGVAQTTGEMQLERAKEMNTDLMEISAHEGARPTHSIWQGKIVSLSGKKGYLSLNDIGYGTVTGFKGANCRHDWYPFIEGISERAYTEKELKELNNQTVRYNGEDIKIYDARQMQRGLERSIREDKRKIAGLNGILTSNTDQLELLEEAKTKFALKSVELKQKEKILEDFSEQTGLKRDRAREKINKFNKSLSQKVSWSNKKSTKTENDDTILTLEECKNIVNSKGIGFSEKNFSTIDSRLLSDNVQRLNELIEKYPKMKAFVKERNVKFNTASLPKDNMAHVLSNIDKSNIEITLSKKYYRKYDELINVENEELTTKHCMDRAENYASTYSLTHEFGHFIQTYFIDEYNKNHLAEFHNMKTRALNAATTKQGSIILRNWESNIADSMAQEIYEIAKKNNKDFSLNLNMSSYGKENSFEFFAECFASLECGKPNELGLALNQYLKERGFL